MRFCLVYVTCKDELEAKAIADDLVSSNIVACANIFPEIRSIYQWQGELRNYSESVLILKTKKENYPLVEQRVKDLHSYECPCIVSFDVDQASKEFLNFLGGL